MGEAEVAALRDAIAVALSGQPWPTDPVFGGATGLVRLGIVEMDGSGPPQPDFNDVDGDGDTAEIIEPPPPAGCTVGSPCFFAANGWGAISVLPELVTGGASVPGSVVAFPLGFLPSDFASLLAGGRIGIDVGPPRLTRVREYGGANADEVVDTPLGLWAPVVLSFVDDAGLPATRVANGSCGCDGTDTGELAILCGEVRERACDIGVPGAEVQPIESIDLEARIARIPLWVGLLPESSDGAGLAFSGAFPGRSATGLPALTDMGHAGAIGLRVGVGGGLDLDVHVGSLPSSCEPENCSHDIEVGATIDYIPDIDFWCPVFLVCLPFLAAGEEAGEDAVTDELKRLLFQRHDPQSLHGAIWAGLTPYLTAGTFGGVSVNDLSIYQAPLAGFGSIGTNKGLAFASASLTHAAHKWFNSPFGPYPNGGWLPVGDIEGPELGDSPDGTPLPMTISFEMDMDHDGVLTPNDATPAPCSANPSAPDADGDGIADYCDLCPTNPVNDPDKDGVCDDICPFDADPLQRNCNRDAELNNVQLDGSPQVLLGDACDPTPCPRAVPYSRIEGAVALGGQVCGTKLNNLFQIRPLADHDPQLGPFPNSTEAVNHVRTRARYCHDDVVNGVACDSPENYNDDQLFAAGCAANCANPELVTQPYHRVSVEVHPSVQGAPMHCSLQNHQSFGPYLDYDYLDLANTNTSSTPHNFLWCFEGDFTRWENTGLVLVDGTPGQLWFHAATDHVDDIRGENLTNHYESALPDAGYGCQGAAVAESAYPFWVVPTLPDPAPELELQALVEFGIQEGQAEILVRTPSDLGILLPGGRFGSIQPALGPVLAQRIANPTLHWANVVEPSPAMGRVGFPVSVALSEDGSRVVDLAYRSADGLVSELDRGIIREETIGSPHAEGYAAFASRVRGAVFVVGGVHPGTDEPTGEIWFSHLHTSAWDRLATPYQPEHVLSATYGSRADAVFVLDETGDGHARLTAIDFVSGQATTLGLWARDAAVWGEVWLSWGLDGHLLITSASAALKRSVVFALDVDDPGAPQALGRRKLKGALAAAPVPDGRGWSLVARRTLTVHANESGFEDDDGCDDDDQPSPPPAKGKKKGTKKQVLDLRYVERLKLKPACLADLGDQL